VIQCKAKSKRTQTQCRQAVVPGRDVCYWHGGASLRGIAHPQLRTGRYSKDLPTRLLTDFELARKDPELLGLEQEIALLDTRTAELLKRIGTGESGATWHDVKASFSTLKLAITEGDTVSMRFALELEHLILTGSSEERVWLDVRATLEHRRRLVESERKRRVEMQQMLSSSQAALLVRTLVESVRTHVTDVDVLGAITADLSRFSLG
jgi:hypothetical protein